jgi:demethylmenaquinone methyltransferase / 2-methoxy-6-polyprenyl-1,4-benzoquinol methylase
MKFLNKTIKSTSLKTKLATGSQIKTEKPTIAKKEQVRQMFNSIAPRYDFLNHLLSAGIDISWRKKVVGIVQKHPHQTILDLATGTGDLAIAAAKLNPDKIVAADISSEMLKYQHKKLIRKNLTGLIELVNADAENLPFGDAAFDAAMIAFGVRNFENLERGLSEISRVLKKDGLIVVLEFSKPERFPVKQLYNFYFRNILPGIGRLVSKNNSAYTYLPDSVGHFPSGEDFTAFLEKAGFSQVAAKPLTMGIASIYTGKK